MTTTVRPRHTRSRPRSSVPVVPLAVLAVIVVLAVGLAIALVGGGDAEPASDEPAFGPVTVEGAALAGFTDTGSDPASGQPAPRISGEAPDGTTTVVGGSAEGRPTLVAFLAHWCPHCQAEVPVLVDLAREGAFDDIRTVAVLTGTNAAAANFPPAAWLEREGWSGDVLLDDEAATAAAAFGLAGYPYLVVLDGDGQVVARTSGEVPAADVVALVDAAASA